MDFRVIGDTYRYGVRVSAIVVKDGKLLTYKVEGQNHLVGGAILVGEASRKAVAREVKEELEMCIRDSLRSIQIKMLSYLKLKSK